MSNMELLNKNAQDLVMSAYNIFNIRTDLGINYKYHMDDAAIESPPTRNGTTLRLIKCVPIDVDKAEKNVRLNGDLWDNIKKSFEYHREICEIRRRSGRTFARPKQEDKLWTDCINAAQVEFSVEAFSTNTAESMFIAEFQAYSACLDDFVPIMNYITSQSNSQSDIIQFYHDNITKTIFSMEFDLANRKECEALIHRFNDHLSSMGTRFMQQNGVMNRWDINYFVGGKDDDTLSLR